MTIRDRSKRCHGKIIGTWPNYLYKIWSTEAVSVLVCSCVQIQIFKDLLTIDTPRTSRMKISPFLIAAIVMVIPTTCLGNLNGWRCYPTSINLWAAFWLQLIVNFVLIIVIISIILCFCCKCCPSHMTRPRRVYRRPTSVPLDYGAQWNQHTWKEDEKKTKQ